MNITALELQTPILPELKHFYTTVLKMSVIEGKDFFTIQLRNSSLTFRSCIVGSKPLYHFAFNVPANAIAAAFEWLKLQQVKPLWIADYQSYIADFSNWKAKSVYFIDTAGNVVEFIARKDLDNDTQEPFSSQQILNINEVGIVFPATTFDGDVATFKRRFDLPFFSKQLPLPTFKALGDDHGLFITVPSGRPWFPTPQALSGIYPIKAKFETGGAEYNLEM